MEPILQGFSDFFFTEEVQMQSGMNELSRLQAYYYFLIRPLNHEEGWKYLRSNAGLGHSGLDGNFLVTDYPDLPGQFTKLLNSQHDSMLIAMVPKKWFKMFGREKDILKILDQMLPMTKYGSYSLPNNYVWGIFTKWHPEREQYEEPGNFYRNSDFQANDAIFQRWLEKHPVSKKLPGNTPSVTGPYTPLTGHHSFHGFAGDETGVRQA